MQHQFRPIPELTPQQIERFWQKVEKTDNCWVLCVLHRCDHEYCVRGDHLFLGTRADNVKDRHAKGRDNRTKGFHYGATSHCAKLTEAQVAEIRAARTSWYYGRKRLAEKYHVAPSTIGYIMKKHTWNHP